MARSKVKKSRKMTSHSTRANSVEIDNILIMQREVLKKDLMVQLLGHDFMIQDINALIRIHYRKPAGIV